MTPEEWVALEQRIDNWVERNNHKLAETAKRTREAIEEIQRDAKIDPEFKRKLIDI